MSKIEVDLTRVNKKAKPGGSCTHAIGKQKFLTGTFLIVVKAFINFVCNLPIRYQDTPTNRGPCFALFIWVSKPCISLFADAIEVHC